MEKKEITRKLKEILSKHEGNTSEGAIYWDSEWVGGKQIPTGGGGYRQEGGKLVCKDKEFYQEMADFISQELDKARAEVERKFVEKYHKRGKEMNVPYSEEDGKEFWQGYKEGYNQGLKDMIVDTYYLDQEFELKLKQ